MGLTVPTKVKNMLSKMAKPSHKDHESGTNPSSSQYPPQDPQYSGSPAWPQQPYSGVPAPDDKSDQNPLPPSYSNGTRPPSSSSVHQPYPQTSHISYAHQGRPSAPGTEIPYTSDPSRMPVTSLGPHGVPGSVPSSMSAGDTYGAHPSEQHLTQPSDQRVPPIVDFYRVHGSNSQDPRAGPSDRQEVDNAECFEQRQHRYHPDEYQQQRFPSDAPESSTAQPKQSCTNSTQTEIPGLALIGNPGAGKSTILNGFADKVVFKAGISLASGLTTTLEGYEVEGVMLYDTPGLADIERKKEAGKELDRLLQNDIPIKIAFVVTLERGRVRPEDGATIDLVLNAIQHNTNDRFGVIINQVSERVREEMEASPEKEALIRCSLTGKHFTCHWCYASMKRELEDQSDRKLMTPDLMHFFWKLPETKPRHAKTVPVDTDNMAEKLEKHKKLIEDIEKANEEQRRIMTEELKLQKEKSAEQESQLAQVERNLGIEVKKIKEDAAAMKTAADAAAREVASAVAREAAGAVAREADRRVSGHGFQAAGGFNNGAQSKKPSVGAAVARAAVPAVLFSTIVEGYKAMLANKFDDGDPNDGQTENNNQELDSGAALGEPQDIVDSQNSQDATTWNYGLGSSEQNDNTGNQNDNSGDNQQDTNQENVEYTELPDLGDMGLF